MKKVLVICLLFSGCFAHSQVYDKLLESTMRVESDGKTCSGALIKKDGDVGVVLTAAHCVGTEARVTFYGPRGFNGKVLKKDVDLDLALVQITGHMPYKTLSMARNVLLFEKVYATLQVTPWFPVEGMFAGLNNYGGDIRATFSIPAKSGGSGAVVVNSEGNIVGLLTNSDTVVSYGASIDQIKVFLEEVYGNSF